MSIFILKTVTISLILLPISQFYSMKFIEFIDRPTHIFSTPL